MKKITVSILTTLLMLSMVFSSSVFAANEETSAWDSFLGLFSANTSATDVGVEYRGHVQNKGDFPLNGSWITGPNQLGTVGEGLRLEAFWIKLTDAPAGLHIKYEVHVQNKGWMAPVLDGNLGGTQGEGLRIEAIKISLVDDAGNVAQGYSVEYKGHVQNQGDTAWFKDGAQLGTTGSGLRLEALEVKIVQTKADMTAYNAAVAAAAALTEADYTAASWTALETALATVVTDANTQAEVDAATAAINAAIDALVMVPQVTGAKAIDANDVATTLPATDVKANSTYEVAFSADVDPLTVNTGTIFITQDDVKQLATISYSSDDKAATIEMSAGSLTPGKDYVLTVNGVKDTNGVAVKSFTTDFTVSINPLLLSATYADAVLGATTDLNGAVVDNATETITFTFNKDIDTNTVSTSTVKIYDITDEEYLVCTVGSTSATTFTVANTTNFETEHDYRLELRSGIEDLAGNALAATNIDFFYGYSAVTVGTSIPAANATGVYNSITASGGNEGFKFKAPFSAAVNPATVSSSTFELVNADTEEVVDGTVTYEAGSYYLIFTPKADLAENTTYTATIDGVKTTKGIAVAKTVRSFTTGDFADPTVVSTTPANAADDVGIGADMVITFSKEMAPASLTMGTNITLIDVSNSNSVVNISAWTASLSQDGKVFTIKIPSASQLNPDHTYKLTVKKAVSDTASPANTLAADVEVLFNTENAAATTLLSSQVGTTYSVSNTVIESGATNVLNTNKIYLNFSQALKTDAGSYILGDLVKLEQKAVGGSYTTVNETATLVNSNKSIQMVLAAGNWVADNTYRITIPTTVKDVNGNAVSKVEFEFTVGTAPAVAPATSYPATFAVNVDSEAPRIAVVIDDTNSDLMASTLNSDTVKVVKKSDSSVAPYTISTINYAKKNVAATATTNGSTTVTLSADADGIAVGNILSIAGDGTYVVTAKSGTTLTVDRATANGGAGDAITYHQGVVYTLDTDAELDSYSEYNVVVDGVKDAAGNPVTATTYTFRTETVTNNLEVVSSTVSNGATGVATGQKVEVLFNEPVTNVTSGSSFVDVASILDGATTRVAFQTAAGVAVSGTYELSNDDKTMTFYPDGYLATGTVYEVRIDSTTASAGGAMDEDYTFSFRTEDTSSAAITSAVYYDVNGNDVIGAGDVLRLTFNTQSLIGTNLNDDDDFTVSGPGTTLGAATFGALSTDNYIDITLAADSVITPGLSTIKVDGTAVTIPTFTTDAVTITAN